MESSCALISPTESEDPKSSPLESSFTFDSKPSSSSSLEDYRTVVSNDRNISVVKTLIRDEKKPHHAAFDTKRYFQVDLEYNSLILSGQKPRRTKKIAVKKPSQYMDHSVLSHNLRFLIIPTSPTRRQDFYEKPDYFRDVVSDAEDDDSDDYAKDGQEDNPMTFKRPRRGERRSTSSLESREKHSVTGSESTIDYGIADMTSQISASSTSRAKKKACSSRQKNYPKKSSEGKKTTVKTGLDTLFRKHIATLVKYRVEHGDYDVPSKYPPNQPLSNWVANITYSYNLIKRGYPGTIRLSEDRMKMLKDIGYEFKDMNVRIKR